MSAKLRSAKHGGVKCVRPQLKYWIFDAFFCNVVQSGVIISPQEMMDFYEDVFIFQGRGAGVGVWVQEAHKASFLVAADLKWGSVGTEA